MAFPASSGSLDRVCHDVFVRTCVGRLHVHFLVLTSQSPFSPAISHFRWEEWCQVCEWVLSGQEANAKLALRRINIWRSRFISYANTYIFRLSKQNKNVDFAEV